MNNTSLSCPLSSFPPSLSLPITSPCHYPLPLSSFLNYLPSFFHRFVSPLSPSLRFDRVPRDDGRGLRVGRAGWSDRTTADPPHLPLHQQRVCLLLVLRPGLRLLPLLPLGLRCGVRRRMSHTHRHSSRGWKWDSHDHCGVISSLDRQSSATFQRPDKKSSLEFQEIFCTGTLEYALACLYLLQFHFLHSTPCTKSTWTNCFWLKLVAIVTLTYFCLCCWMLAAMAKCQRNGGHCSDQSDFKTWPSPGF